MGNIYPAAGPTLSGDAMTIHRFLKNPTLVQRRVNELAAQRFLADFLFTGRVEATGGAVLYEVGGVDGDGNSTKAGIYTTRPPEVVNPGAEYPRTTLTSAPEALAKVVKRGQDVPITDEKIGREKGNALEKGLTQVANTVRRDVDQLAMTALAGAVTKTITGSAVWATDATKAWLDIELAAASIDEEDQGYEADTVVVSPTRYAYLVYSLLPALPREQSNGAVTTGNLPQVAGKTIVPGKLPDSILALVVDRKVYGSLAYENVPSPEYTGSSATGIETWSRRDPKANDSWLVRGRRSVVPLIQEPAAARKITGI